MKLGELKSQIRHRKGNPTVTVTLGQGVFEAIAVQKASLLEALDRAFPARNTETNLRMNDDGLIVSEGAPLVSETASPVKAVSEEIDDLDELDDLDSLGDLDHIECRRGLGAEIDYLDEL